MATGVGDVGETVRRCGRTVFGVSRRSFFAAAIFCENAAGRARHCRTKYRSSKNSRLRGHLYQGMMHDTLPFEPPPSSRHAGRRQSQGFTVAVQACPMCIKIEAQVGERRSIMKTDNVVRIKTDGTQHKQ